MVHQKKPQRMLRLFCRTIPSGTDSHFAQALVFVSRGLYFLRTVCYGITVHGLPTIIIYYKLLLCQLHHQFGFGGGNGKLELIL